MPTVIPLSKTVSLGDRSCNSRYPGCPVAVLRSSRARPQYRPGFSEDANRNGAFVIERRDARGSRPSPRVHEGYSLRNNQGERHRPSSELWGERASRGRGPVTRRLIGTIRTSEAALLKSGRLSRQRISRAFRALKRHHESQSKSPTLTLLPGCGNEITPCESHRHGWCQHRGLFPAL
jgi:hypothetical protein